MVELNDSDVILVRDRIPTRVSRHLSHHSLQLSAGAIYTRSLAPSGEVTIEDRGRSVLVPRVRRVVPVLEAMGSCHHRLWPHERSSATSNAIDAHVEWPIRTSVAIYDSAINLSAKSTRENHLKHDQS